MDCKYFDVLIQARQCGGLLNSLEFKKRTLAAGRHHGVARHFTHDTRHVCESHTMLALNAEDSRTTEMVVD